MPTTEVATRAGVSRRDFLRMAGAVGAVGVLGPVACGSPTASSPGTSAARDRLKLPGVLSYELNLPSLVAQAKDYFGEENITLTDFVLGSGGTMRTAVIAKEFDFGLFAFVHVPIARLANSPWKMVLTTYDREIFSMIVRTSLKDRVKKVADLKGMKVGFTTPGAGSWAMASVYLEKAGLRPETDVQFVPLGGDTGVIYTAIQTGRVDAFSAWEPITTRALESGAAFALAPIWKDEVHKEYLGSADALALGLVTREDVIKEKGDLVKRMVNAHKKGLDFIRRSSPDAIADVVLKNPKTAPQFEGLDRALVIKMFDRIKPGFKTGCLSKAGFKAEMDLSVKYKLVKAPITYEEFGDTKYAGSCA
jgi:NitT/TauT family transport system substrate-binding protein